MLCDQTLADTEAADAAKGEADMVEWLLDQNPPSNVLVADRTGRTPADAAADAGFPNLAVALWDREKAVGRAKPWLEYIDGLR